jgi:hypothetical protein
LAGAFFSTNFTIVRPEVPFDTVIESMLLAACAKAALVPRSVSNARSHARAPRAVRTPGHDVVNENERAHFFRSCVFVSAWISCSVPVRSVQSPLPSCTSSFMRISLR